MRQLASLLVSVLIGLTLLPEIAQSQDNTGSISGYVVDGSGNPLGGAQLILVDLLNVNAVAADDGSFVLSGVAAGDHVLIGQINDFIGDPIGVTVPPNDVASVNVVLAVLPPTVVPTPAPPPTDVPAPPPTSTPIPQPQTVTLTGTVRDDQGSAPPDGTRVQLFDLPFISTKVGGDGSFQLSNIPPASTHFVYASAPQKSPSDVLSVTFGSDSVSRFSIQLKPFAGGGNPTEFSGRVVFTGGGSGVGGATVWRLGAAGRTTTASNGTFVLIDATRSRPDPNASPGRPPDNVTLVAATSDRWGYRNIDTNKPPAPLIIALNQPGNPPSPPKVFDWKSHFSAGQAQFFTAFWKGGQHKDLGIRLVLSDNTVQNPGGNSIGQCVGDCGGISTSGLVVTLPPGQSFTIKAWNEATDSAEQSPDWTEAHAVGV